MSGRQVAAPIAATRGPDRRWIGLAFIALAQLMIALDATIVNIALPSAQRALGFADADRQWVITGYTLAFGCLLLPGGRIADSVALGRRRALIIGLVGFALASALSGAATSLTMLVVARALQGACAALLAPTALSLLALMFTEPPERAKAFGVYGGIAASGGAIGLLLGGLLSQYLEWRWCLYVNVPIAVCAAVGAALVLPEARTQSAAATPRSGVVLFGLVPLQVIWNRRRGPAYLSALLAVGGIFGAFLTLTYVLQAVLALSPLQAGLAFLPLSASTLLVSTQLAPRLAPRFSPWLVMAFGFTISTLGMLVLATLTASSNLVATVLPAEVLLGVGVACVMVTAASLATSGVDRRDAGIASAVLNTAQQLGASLGTALMNAVAAVVTAAYLAAGPSVARGDALAHGYAAAAAWGAGLLLAGAVLDLVVFTRS